MDPAKVLICGAGIAGCSLAFWLSKQGHKVTVIERFPELRSTGLQIDLRGHGIEVLKRMGLEATFRKKAVIEEGFRVVDKSGRTRAFFPANRSGTGLQSFTTDFEIMRGDFVRLLYDATHERVEYVFGVSIQSFKQGMNEVQVVFSNGQRDTFDILVGADGQGSQTRKQMLGPGVSDSIKFLDLRICYYTIPAPITAGEQHIATAFLAPGSRTIMTRRHAPEKMQVYLSCSARHPRLVHVRRNDIAKEKEAFADIFRDAGWQCQKYVDALADTRDFYCEQPGLVRSDKWFQGRVVLLGDAAYCPTANTGMGTTSAVVGAYILAGEIANRPKDQAGEALQEYEQKFRPFMNQVQRELVRDGRGWTEMVPSTAFGIAVMNFVVGMASLFRLDILAKFVLKEDVRDWELPTY